MSEQSKSLSGRVVTISIILWVSFLLAAVATMLFFATFDPEDLNQIATFPMKLDRSSGYSIGFFLFWLLLIVNGSVVSWLASRTPKEPNG